MTGGRLRREQQREQTRRVVHEVRGPDDASRLRALLHGADLPLVVHELERMGTAQRATAFRMLPRPSAVRALQMLEPTTAAELVGSLPDADVRDLVARLEPDDRARLVEGLPEDLRHRLLATLDPEELAATEGVLAHAPETVGRWSTPRLVSVPVGASVEEALAAVEADTGRAETVYVLPVVDEARRVVGVVSLRRLLASPGRTPVREVMREPISVYASEDQEAAALVVRDHGALAVPVLDDDHRLVGMFTVDDAMRVLRIEEDEDDARSVGMERLGRHYLATSALGLARGRMVWLLVLIVAATLTVNVLDFFEDRLQQVVSLALFIPLLIGTGGNVGAQAASTMIRALAVDDVRPGDAPRVFLKELLTGLTLGLVLAAVAYLPAVLFTETRVALVICLSLVVVCALAATAGGIIPMVARRLGVDPAVVSAPFITTFVDATGLVVYFLIAGAVLGL